MLDVIYDGDCPFCRFCRRWAEFRTPPGHLNWIARPESPSQALDNEGFRLSCECDSLVVADGRQFWVKSRAVFRLAAELRPPWHLLALFRFLPLRLTDALYDQVAKRRKG